MILSKSAIVRINGNQIKRYRDLGYDFKTNDLVDIKIEHLNDLSSALVDVVCDFCGSNKIVKYIDYKKNIKKYNLYACSRKCSAQKSKQTFLEKYGVTNYMKTDEYKEKTKKTNLEKYGVEHYSKTNESKERIKQTNLEKYGVEYYMQSESYRIKYTQTCLDKYGESHYSKTDDFIVKFNTTCLKKYGVEYYSQTNECKERVKKTSMDRYNSEYYMQTYEYNERVKQTSMRKYGVEHHSKADIVKNKNKQTCINRYGVSSYVQSECFHSNTIIGNDVNYIKYLGNNISLFNCDNLHTFEIDVDNYHSRIIKGIPLCTVCNPIGEQSSIKEKMLLEYIQSIYNSEIISGYRDGLEIDIYLPELKIGFEFNGLYWHSNKYKEKNYHINKTNYFKERNIRIIHVLEDDWTYKQDIVKSQISNLLKNNTNKIFARKCVVKLVDTKEARQFLDGNHIQGIVNSKLKLGLYYNGELVSIMTFDRFEGRKKMEDGGWNLSRFCNKINTNVVGGASKLLNHFIKNYDVSRIVSYADKDWSIGNLYYTLGFNNIGGNGPDYKYIVDNKRVHKSRYKKSKLGIKGKSMTESERMKELNVYRIYDCGKIKFEKVI